MNQKSLVALLVLCAALLQPGCTKKNTFVEPPPPEVTVQGPDQRTVSVDIGFPGRLAAKESIEIRARVDGYLDWIGFEDGTPVKMDQPLFLIEPKPFEASVKSKEALLAVAVAEKSLAQVNHDRRELAYQTQSISEIEVISAKADLEAAEARVLNAQSELIQANIDLSYTTNTAPADGRTGRRLVSVGNLVSGTQGTLLTTLIVQDPMHVYFNVDERSILPFLRDESGRKSDPESEVLVKLEFADGVRYQLNGKEVEGRVDFIDNQADPETGTLSARAEFNNPNGTLLPGMYGKILIPKITENAILVPDLSIQRDIGGTYVLTVNGQNEVEAKYVELGDKVGDERIIKEGGLDGSERVIVKGLQRARPGIKVQPIEGTASTQAQDAASSNPEAN